MQVLRWPASTRSIFLEGQLARPFVRTLSSSCPGPYLDSRNGPLRIEILVACVSFVNKDGMREHSLIQKHMTNASVLILPSLALARCLGFAPNLSDSFGTAADPEDVRKLSSKANHTASSTLR